MFCECGAIVRIPQYGKKQICSDCGKINEIKYEDEELIFEKKYDLRSKLVAKNVEAPTIKHKCMKCGSGEMQYTVLQTRSADEGQTVFYYCKCGYRIKLDT